MTHAQKPSEPTSYMTSAIPVLPVVATEVAAQFYAEKLGFAVEHVDEAYAVLARDGVELHLWAANDKSWTERDRKAPVETGAESFLAGTASCRVCVDLIEPLYALCRDAGVVHPNGELTNRPYGLREFTVLDQDGNAITFFVPTA